MLLKNLYNENYINNLSDDILLVFKSFNKKEFFNTIFNDTWENRELKDRMRYISTTLALFLPKDYKKSIDILIKVFNNRLIYMENRKEKQGLENIIFQDFVEVYGLDDFKTSMIALECFTQYSSSEFAIRQFILKYENETMIQLKEWTKSNSEHTRRLASEGCRSRLPWAIALPKYKKDPLKVLEILELLKNDNSKYVQKSVANNLNDISKDNIPMVKQKAKEWFGKSKDLDWIVKHGCRTLLKDGDVEILALFGFTPPINVSIENININPIVKMEEYLDFSFTIKSDEILGKLRVEYAINFLRQNNKSNKKVFKICEGEYADKLKKIDKKYSFKKISTRKYYKGKHSIEFIINGQSLEKREFELV